MCAYPLVPEHCRSLALGILVFPLIGIRSLPKSLQGKQGYCLKMSESKITEDQKLFISQALWWYWETVHFKDKDRGKKYDEINRSDRESCVKLWTASSSGMIAASEFSWGGGCDGQRPPHLHNWKKPHHDIGKAVDRLVGLGKERCLTAVGELVGGERLSLGGPSS